MNEKYIHQITTLTAKELLDIYINDIDYQPEFVELVRKEMIRRGIPYEHTHEAKEKEKAIRKLKIINGEKGSPLYMILIALLSLIGGPIGIIGGYIYAFSKKTDDEGIKHNVYDNNTRYWGRIILFIGLGSLLIRLIIKENPTF